MPRQKKQRSNDEVVNDLMVFGNPLKQGIIIEAITRYVDKVAEAGLEETRRQFGPNSWISPDAWYACSIEIKRALDDHLNRAVPPHIPGGTVNIEEEVR